MKKKSLNRSFTFDKLEFKKEIVSVLNPKITKRVVGGGICHDTNCTMDPCPAFLNTRIYSGGGIPD